MQHRPIMLAALLALSTAFLLPSLARAQIVPGHEPGVGVSQPASDRASNMAVQHPTDTIAPTLPDPGLGQDGQPYAYLKAAHEALAHGRTGVAQQALEMAETRALDRVVPPDEEIRRSRTDRIADIARARAALGEGDLKRAMSLIEFALAQ